MRVRDASTLSFYIATATSEIYTLSLHDALPISVSHETIVLPKRLVTVTFVICGGTRSATAVDHERHGRSEEHTSELQSRQYLVCRLLLEKKKNNRLCNVPALYDARKILVSDRRT